MKNILSVATACVILVSLLLCGCHSEQALESSTIPTLQHLATTDGASFYAEVLQDYETIVHFRLSDDFENNWNNNGLPSISAVLTVAIQENSGAEWSNAIVGMTAGLEAPAMSSFGYILRDINNDDFPELFFVREDHTILAIFTNRNDKLVLLDVFWPKYECIITNEEELYIRTDSGASCTDYLIQTLTSEETLLKAKQFGFDGISAEAEQLYYEIVDGAKQSIGEKRFNELLHEHPFEFGSEWLLQKLTLLN